MECGVVDLGTVVEVVLASDGEFGRSAGGAEGIVGSGTSDAVDEWAGLTAEATSSSDSSELNPS